MIIQFSDINVIFPLNCITVTNIDISQKETSFTQILHHVDFSRKMTALSSPFPSLFQTHTSLVSF